MVFGKKKKKNKPGSEIEKKLRNLLSVTKNPEFKKILAKAKARERDSLSPGWPECEAVKIDGDFCVVRNLHASEVMEHLRNLPIEFSPSWLCGYVRFKKKAPYHVGLQRNRHICSGARWNYPCPPGRQGWDGVRV